MLCYSTGSLPPVSIEQIAAILEPTPFEGIELVITPAMLSHWDDPSFWEPFLETAQKKQLKFRNTHLGHPYLLSDQPHEPGLGSPDPVGRNQKIEAVKKCMRIAREINSPHLTLTTGTLDTRVPVEPQEKRIYDSLDQILKDVPPGLQMGLEQEPEHVIHSAEQMESLCRHYDGMIRLNFDVGHSQVLGEDISTALRRLFPFIYNIHFEDISNRVHRHLLFGEGDISFSRIFSTLKKLNYRDDMTPDLYPFVDDHERALDASVRLFNTHWPLI